jgi:hypothetical protein
MSGRSRIYIRGRSDQQSLRAIQAIDEQFVSPFNCTLLQFSILFTQAPTTPQFFEVGKLSALGIGWEILFRNWDPTEIPGGLQMTCNEHFEIARNETLFLRYPNTDLLLIGYEAVLTEVF